MKPQQSTTRPYPRFVILAALLALAFACDIDRRGRAFVGNALIDAGRSFIDTGVANAADADVPGIPTAIPECTQWEVRAVSPPTTREVLVPEQGGSGVISYVFDSFALETGWEPFGGDFSRGPAIALRRCVAR